MSDEAVSISVRYWIIRKASRDGYDPYAGPACVQAGVTPGCVYPDAASAQVDADRLEAVNPVGFEVVEVSRSLEEAIGAANLLAEAHAREFAAAPGASWRLACKPVSSFYHPFEAKSADGDHLGPFDELVVDHWLHIEQMTERAWWMRVGEREFWVTVLPDGKVTVEDRAE